MLALLLRGYLLRVLLAFGSHDREGLRISAAINADLRGVSDGHLDDFY